MANDDSDYYSDAAEGNPGPKKDKEPREKTALLPKSFFPDSPEPGKVCKVRVVKVYEDEALVEYVHEGKKAEPEQKPSNPMPPESDEYT